MTFLFDIGRVLLDFDFESSLVHLLPPDADDPHERLAHLLDRKDEFESGAITPDEYIAWALGILGSHASADDFRRAWRNIFTVNEPMWKRVRQLAADGHRLILFSNNNGIHCPWVFETYPEMSLFSAAVLSHETGFIKPHPEIYHHAIRTHGLDPAETLYIDDLPQNIATGRDLGFRCHLYDLRNHAAFEVWLDSEISNLKSQI